MKIILSISLSAMVMLTMLHADTNTTQKRSKAEQLELEKQIKAQMAREEKYAKEQKFYNSDEYNFSAAQVDPKTLDNVPVIEPEYDFDITDVYRDDQ